jgi:hypothetical protein
MSCLTILLGFPYSSKAKSHHSLMIFISDAAEILTLEKKGEALTVTGCENP